MNDRPFKKKLQQTIKEAQEMKKIGYRPNFQAFPDKVKSADAFNCVVAILSGVYQMAGNLDQEGYNKLADWMKVYWIPYEYEVPEKKGSKIKKGR